jgi:hypothetical protein
MTLAGMADADTDMTLMLTPTMMAHLAATLMTLMTLPTDGATDGAGGC